MTKGSEYKTQDIADFLRCEPASHEFNMAILNISQALYKHHLVLSCRGTKGERYYVLSDENTSIWHINKASIAEHTMRKCLQIGAAVDKSKLSDQQARIHEHAQQRIAFKVCMLGRAKSIQKVLAEHSPKLME